MAEFNIVVKGTPYDRIEAKLAAGQPIYAWEIVRALQYGTSDPLPPRLLDHVCGLIEGKIRNPKGRPPPNPLVERWRLMMIRGCYDRYFGWLRARQRRQRQLDHWHWKVMAKQNRAPPTPAALAAVLTSKLVARLGYPYISWRRVQNLARSRK